MAILCQPAVVFPEETITLEETLDLAERAHADNPNLTLALRLIKNTGVEKQNIVQPIEETLRHPGFEVRNLIHDREAKRMVPVAVNWALENAGLKPAEINVIIFVSCTGFSMPSLTAWMINEMGFKPTTVQIPIARSSTCRTPSSGTVARR